MKVFFMCSPRGNLGECKHIYSIIVKLGHTHTSDFVVSIDPKSFYKVDDAIWNHRYQERIKQISEADICIFESSIPSLAIGQLFQEAVREEKPTIALYKPGNKPHTLISTEGNERRVQVVEYTEENITEIVSDVIADAEEFLNTRFTMILPNPMIRFLDDRYRKTGISRSEYIRSLIQKDMENI